MHSSKPGYIFLVTILVIGVIATATATSLLLLGWAAEQNGLLVMQSNQAFEYAQTCMEQTLLELKKDNTYAGDRTVAFTTGLTGTCDIELIAGVGNENRSVCVTGYSGDSVRRLEINIARIYPSLRINSWQEVTDFSLCD